LFFIVYFWLFERVRGGESGAESEFDFIVRRQMKKEREGEASEAR
jgi:hypothetical protein